MQLPFPASKAFDVASDGTTLYVSFTPPGSSQVELGTMPIGGGTLTTVATASNVVLAAFEDSVFYATGSEETYEIHQRTSTTDAVLGSVDSVASVTIAANATDVYVYGSDYPGESNLWRLSRLGRSRLPDLVTITDGDPASFALGSTAAILRTHPDASVVAPIPGPGSPSQVQLGVDPIVFSGDLGFDVVESTLDANTSDYSIAEFGVTGSIFQQGGEFYEVGTVERDFLTVAPLRVDATRLYWVVADQVNSYLSTGTLDKNSHTTLCSWPWGTSWKSVLEQDATHLYSLESVGQDQWVIDVLAKP